MTVEQLIEHLRQFPPGDIVALSSMGHHYDSVNHERSHGSIHVLPYSDGRVLICEDAGGIYRRWAEKLAE